MRTPQRKPGKYADDKPDPYITQGKYNKLKANLKRLIDIDRPLAIKDVKDQAAFGDFSDNAAYGIAKGKLRGLNNRILKIESSLRNAIIIEENQKSQTVQLGSIVTVESGNKEKFGCPPFVDGVAGGNNTKTYKILGSDEVDIAKGIISHNSPLGSALLGKKKGETAKIKIKDKEVEFRIVEVR